MLSLINRKHGVLVLRIFILKILLSALLLCKKSKALTGQGKIGHSGLLLYLITFIFFF